MYQGQTTFINVLTNDIGPMLAVINASAMPDGSTRGTPFTVREYYDPVLNTTARAVHYTAPANYLGPDKFRYFMLDSLGKDRKSVV